MFPLLHTSMRRSKTFAFAGLLSLRCRILPVMLFVLTSVLRAQQSPSAAMQPPAGSNWEHVKALPPNTKVHVTTDHGGKTCRIFAVSDETLTCAKGSQAGAALQRTGIKHIKLTHYVRSALVGAGIGGGIGALAGGIAARGNGCKAGQTFCFDIVTGTDVAVIFGVGAAVVGSVVGGTTDLARGSSIYVRP
jgi:hypothetical protein